MELIRFYDEQTKIYKLTFVSVHNFTTFTILIKTIIMETSDQVQEKIVQQVSAPLYSAKGWMKLIGILLIVVGVVYALSIVGIIFAWIPIWLGILVTGAANKIDLAHKSGDKYSFIEAQKKIGLYFTIYGVITLIGLILTLLFFVIALSTGFLADFISNIQNSNMQYY